MRKEPLWKRAAARRAVAALFLAAVAASCGGSDSDDPLAAEDTLALLDRELDLAMSGDTARAALRDEAGERDPEPPGRPRRPVSRSAAAPPPPAPAPAAEPEPEVRRPGPTSREHRESEGPRVEGRSVAGGTTFEVTLNQELSTRHNQGGDLFSARLLHPLTDGRLVLVPAGATIIGEVTSVRESGGQGEVALLNLAIREVSFDGETYPVEASILEANPETRSRSSTGAKAAKIGGAAVAGAILGRLLGGDALGTVIGTVVAGAAGTAIVLGTEDVDAVLPKGSRMTLRLDGPLEVPIELP